MEAFDLTLSAAAPLEVRSVQVHEAMSAPFGVAIVCASTDAHLDPDAYVGKDARLALDRGALGARAWGGVCTAFTAMPGEVGGLFHYAVHIGPRIALLAHKTDHRAYTSKTTPEIVASIFGLVRQPTSVAGVSGQHTTHAMRAQRGESDLAFAERLLEDEGISYWFAEQLEDGKPVTRVVLSDAPEHVQPVAGAELPVIVDADRGSKTPFATAVRGKVSTRSGALTHTAHDPKRPRYSPRATASASARGEGRLTIETHGADAGGTDRERDARADAALGSARHDRSVVGFTTNVCTYGPGDAVELGASKKRLLVTGTKLTWRGDRPLQVVVTGAPDGERVRPAKKAARPRHPGVESAFVDGPEGSEIHTDDQGRVQLRFAWDLAAREGADKHDGPWARIDAAFAGAGFGAIAVPRVGDEVLVGYLHGDTDEPVVIGRLNNASSPTSHPLPHAGAKTGLTTSSTGAGAEGGGHELTFDDTAGQELVRMRSEKDLAKNVKSAERATVTGNSTAIVGGSRTTTVGDSTSIAVGNMREVRMASVTDPRPGSAAGPELSALPTRQEIVAQRITLTTGGATIVLDGPDIVVSAQNGLRIQAGGTVSIQGEPFVHLNPLEAPPAGDVASAAPVGDHVVWFQLHTDDEPVAGVTVHVTETTPAPGNAQVATRTMQTDGNGEVRIAVADPGTHVVTVAKGSKGAPDGVPVATVPTQPTPNASPSKHPLPVHMEIISPKHGVTYHLHHEPEMPSIPIEARVKVGDQVVHEGRVSWAFELEGQYRVRSGSSGYREQAYRLPGGHVHTLPNEEQHFRLAPSELVGGALSVVARFDGGAELGNVRAKQKVSGMKVLGVNAPREDIYKFLAEHGGKDAWVFMRLFCWESAHTLGQFAKGSGGGNTPGEPLYGPPSGVGIVQRDPTAEEWHFPKHAKTQPNNFFPRMFWDWRKNLTEGISSFHDTYVARAKYDLGELQRNHGLPAPSEGVIMRAAIRRYNGGTEYQASGRNYVVSPVSSNPTYVENVLSDPHVDAHKYPVPHDALAHVWPG